MPGRPRYVISAPGNARPSARSAGVAKRKSPRPFARKTAMRRSSAGSRFIVDFQQPLGRRNRTSLTRSRGDAEGETIQFSASPRLRVRLVFLRRRRRGRRSLERALDDGEVLGGQDVDVALEGQAPVRGGPLLDEPEIAQQRLGRDEPARREDLVWLHREAVR